MNDINNDSFIILSLFSVYMTLKSLVCRGLIVRPKADLFAQLIRFGEYQDTRLEMEYAPKANICTMLLILKIKWF